MDPPPPLPVKCEPKKILVFKKESIRRCPSSSRIQPDGVVGEVLTVVVMMVSRPTIMIAASVHVPLPHVIPASVAAVVAVIIIVLFHPSGYQHC